MSWNELTHFAGFDWAKDHHDVVVVDRIGKIVKQFSFEHTAPGWRQFQEHMAEFAAVGLAIEARHGTILERLLELQSCVYAIHPQRAKAYRQRKVPSGNKTDQVDAWSLADALRLDGADWRALSPQDPLTQELRLLCQAEVALIQERTALINQLQHALYEYYPAALEAFEEWTLPSAWAFVVAFPTAEVLAQGGKRKWEKFLHAQKLARPETYQKRLQIFARAKEFVGAPALVRAKSRLAVARAKQLEVLQQQIDEHRQAIQRLFLKHPDVEVFSSLPGAGEKIAPRLLAAIGEDRALFPDAQSLQCLAGTAPVSYQSGQVHRVRLRQQCNKFFRHTVHLWANLSRACCPWAATYYHALREKGKSHACALRALGHRWLKILWKMWQTRTPYDPALHARNQLQHGSWVAQLLGKELKP